MRYRTKGGYAYGNEQLDPRLRQGLVGAWLGRPGSGPRLLDASGFNRHGLITGVPKWTTGPNGMQALDFDGTNDYVVLPDHPDMDFGNGVTDRPFSIALWGYPRQVDTQSFRMLTRIAPAGSPYEWQFDTRQGSGGLLSFYVLDASAASFRGRLSSIAPALKVWQHFVVTYDGRGGTGAADGIKIYMDAVRVDTTDSNSGTYTAMEDTGLDTYVGLAGASRADGKIGSILIYNRVITDFEIKLLGRVRQ